MKLRFPIIFAVFLTFFISNVALAQFTLLPGTDKSDDDCKIRLNIYELTGVVPTVQKVYEGLTVQPSNDYDQARNNAEDKFGVGQVPFSCGSEGMNNDDKECKDLQAASDKLDKANDLADSDILDPWASNERSDLLGCAIKTGRISLQMIPYFISYISNFLLSIIGLISVLFIVLGGYFYIYGGLTDAKEKGKKYIYHALLGLAVASLSWIIVNVIMGVITS